MTPEQDRKIEFVVSAAAEDAVRRAQDAYGMDDLAPPSGAVAGIAGFIFIIAVAGGLGFLFGAAWRGSQMIGC